MNGDTPGELIFWGIFTIGFTYLYIRVCNNAVFRWFMSRHPAGGSIGRRKAEISRRVMVFLGYFFMALGAYILLIGLIGWFKSLL